MLPIQVTPAVVTAVAITLAIFLYVSADVMGLFPSKNQLPVDGKTVLLTGASQGMGKAVAKILARKGANVVIVARNVEKLEKALAEIKSCATSPSQRFLHISADVTRPEENSRILTETTSWNSGSPPDIVWAIAGSAHPSLFMETPVETLRAQMDINYWAAAYLTHASLGLFVSHRSSTASGPPDPEPRHIIMTSSAAAYVGVAGYSPYAPCKAAIRSLADCLRGEALLIAAARRRRGGGGGEEEVPPAERDVKVHLVVPGTILSPGFEEEEKVKHPVTKSLEETDPKQTEGEVAAAAVCGLEKGRFTVTTSWFAEILRAGALGPSPRENIVVNTVLSWIIAVVWLFMGPDLDGKIWKYGKTHGMARHELSR